MNNDSNHIDEKKLALYVLGAKEVIPERATIKHHLRTCKGCSLLYKELREYYQDFAKLEAQGKTKTDAIVAAEQLIALKWESPASIRKWETAGALTRIPAFFRSHPIASTASFAVAVLALVLFLRPERTLENHLAYARAKNEFLVGYDQAGKELWKKHIGPGYDLSAIYNSGYPLRAENYVRYVDVNGDRSKEVIAIFGQFNQTYPLSRTILCLNDDGSERWRYEFHRKMRFGDKEFADDYIFSSMAAGDFDNDGSVEVIAISHQVPYYPTAVLKLDGNTGNLLAEYWHSGYLYPITHRDIDGDGVEELFFGGENNGYNLAALLVLDPRSMMGYGPAPPDYTPKSLLPGSEKYYLLFPRSDIGKFSTFKRSNIGHLGFTGEKLLHVETGEDVRGKPVSMHFLLDSTMRCTKIGDTDYFESTHKQLEAEGKLTRQITPEYYEELRKNILYWDGEKFVKTATMNKRASKMAIR